MPGFSHKHRRHIVLGFLIIPQVVVILLFSVRSQVDINAVNWNPRTRETDNEMLESPSGGTHLYSTSVLCLVKLLCWTVHVCIQKTYTVGPQTQFFLEGCLRSDLLENWIIFMLPRSLFCLLPERCVTDHTGISMKGLSGWKLKFCLTTKTFFAWTTSSRTELFEMGDIQEPSLTESCFYSASYSWSVYKCLAKCLPAADAVGLKALSLEQFCSWRFPIATAFIYLLRYFN